MASQIPKVTTKLEHVPNSVTHTVPFSPTITLRSRLIAHPIQFADEETEAQGGKPMCYMAAEHRTNSGRDYGVFSLSLLKATQVRRAGPEDHQAWP